jgi:hypothetical protein
MAEKLTKAVNYIIKLKAFDAGLSYSNPFKLKRYERKQLQRYVHSLNKFMNYIQGE